MIDDRDIPYLWLQYGTEQNYRLFSAIQEEYYYLEQALDDVRHNDFSRFPKMKDEIKERLHNSCTESFLERYVGWLNRKQIGVVTYDSYSYPSLLKQISYPPVLLFYKGRLEPDIDLSIAIAGTRTCTEYGKVVAQKFASGLVKAGATIISGLATGIDAYAALGALDVKDSDYPVIGVLGCGIDTVYPKGNEKLYDAVADRGCLITEFLPKTNPYPYNFPIRNRIISGLSQGTLIVEAGERSGASITAGHALDQGREVFAIPGRINDPMSLGTNRMIIKGEAKPVSSVRDILDEFGVSDIDDEKRKVEYKALAPIEQKIIDSLLQGEKNEDEILAAIQAPVGELFATLTAMSFTGLIKHLPGNIYSLDTFSVDIVY